MARIFLCLAISGALCSSAAAFDERPSDFFVGNRSPDKPWSTASGPVMPHGSVAALVADAARQRLGGQWVATALAISHHESGNRCNAVGPKTRHGRALGVFQVLPGSAAALGVSPGSLTSCAGGIEAGIRHMLSCLQAGVSTSRQMAACHVSGTAGWRRPLRGSAERYKQKYVRIVGRG